MMKFFKQHAQDAQLIMKAQPYIEAYITQSTDVLIHKLTLRSLVVSKVGEVTDKQFKKIMNCTMSDMLDRFGFDFMIDKDYLLVRRP